MNYTGLFECICAISEKQLHKAPLLDEGESVFLQHSSPRDRFHAGEC